MPLAPLNAFAGNPLDRGGDRRNDPDWIAAKAASPDSLAAVLVDGGPLLEDGPEGPRLAWLPLSQARELASGEPVFLGLWKDAPVFAVEATSSPDPLLGAVQDMRAAAAVLSPADCAMAGAARSLFEWRRRHGFCANCGAATVEANGGWKRLCGSCGAEHFPQVDPVAIMLPVYSGGAEPRCLLGRQANWPAGRMSALAGFMEPGESIEEACAREVSEEAGLEVISVRYHSSQPWPFPSQLMIGLICEVSSDAATPDLTELEAVTWLTKKEAADCLAERHPTIKAPPPFAIAHTLLKAWVEA